ncbi:MAG: Rieske 2Fe-2S domain-containing protein [Rhizobiaceae bacterium]|nr:Rieske 2Fe-2S domain-containing protein [Rhizobiaceae bacterium]
MHERWVRVCDVEAVDREDVLRFDHEGRTFAVYRAPDGQYFATDGLCTHERVHLANGLVMGATIECPRHNGRFDYRTGKAKGVPACIDLATHPIRVEGGAVMLMIGPGEPSSSPA